MDRTPRATPQPFVTRRTVGLACLGAVVMLLAVGSVKATQNAQGLLLAGGYGVLVTCLLVAYAGAVILAVRARSLLLLLVIFLIPIPPVGPLLCVMLTGGVPRAPVGRR